MRFNKDGQALKGVTVLLPAEWHRRLESEKARTGEPVGKIIERWIRPHIERLAVHPCEQDGC